MAQQLSALLCAPAIRFKLDRLLEALAFAQTQALQTTREIHRFCLQDPELNRCLGYLTSIPGIGVITGTHLLARIGDWRHLRNVRQLAAFLGVVASERSTKNSVTAVELCHGLQQVFLRVRIDRNGRIMALDIQHSNEH